MRTTINHHLASGLANNMKQRQLMNPNSSHRIRKHTKSIKTLRDTIDLATLPTFDKSITVELNNSKGAIYSRGVTSLVSPKRNSNSSSFPSINAPNQTKHQNQASADVLRLSQSPYASDLEEPYKIKIRIDSEPIFALDNVRPTPGLDPLRSTLQSRQKELMYKTVVGSDAPSWNKVSKVSSNSQFRPFSRNVTPMINQQQRKVSGILSKVRENMVEKSETTLLETLSDEKSVKEYNFSKHPSGSYLSHAGSGILSPTSKRDPKAFTGLNVQPTEQQQNENLGIEEMTMELKKYREILTSKLKMITTLGETKFKMSKRFKRKIRDKDEFRKRFIDSLLTAVKKLEDLGLTSDEVLKSFFF
jgi:hypothetical protein